MKRNLGTTLIVAGVLSAFYTPQVSAVDVSSYSELSTAIQNGTSPINITANITAEGNLGSITSGSTSITMGSNSLSGTNSGTSYGGISVGTGAALSISGVMKDFTAPNGGAASVNNGTLTIDSNSTFTNNTATNWYGGGAIYGRDSEITINDNVTFDRNNTTELDDGSGYGNAGGAIASWGTDLTIGNGADFKNNGTGTSAGGAIYSDGTTAKPDGTFSDVGSLTIGNDADFTDNSSSARGGAIYNGDAKAEIGSGANFSGNTSGSGGAIYNFNAGYPKVEGNDVGIKIGSGANFNNNTATTGNGGAITNNYSDIEIGKDSTFTNNTAAGNGGAINNVSYKDDVDDLPGTVTINGGAEFSGNTAAGNGGAIYNGGTLNLDTADGNITFSNNTANGSSNDLFQKDGGVTNITGDSNTISFGSGIAGSGEINKTGDNTLELAADNSGFTGTFTQSNGETVVTSDGSMFTGENNIEGGNIKFEDESASKDSTINLTSNSSGTTHGSMEISIGDGKTVDLGTTITAESSQNIVNKTGSGDLTVTDKDYSDFEGTFNSKEGTTEFKGINAKLFQTTNVESGSELKLTDGAQAVKGDLKIASGGTVTLSGAGSAILAAVDTDISGDMNINTGSTVDLNTGDSWTGKVTIDGGELNYSDLDTNGQLVANSGDLNINSGTLNISNGSVIADAVDTTIKGDLNITGTGDVTLNTGDSWTGDITLGGGSLTVDEITNDGKLIANSGDLNLGSNGTLNIGAGSVIKDAVVTDIQGELNISNGGQVTINTGDSVSGSVNLETDGKLTIDNIALDFTGNKFTQNNGALNINNNGSVKIDNGLAGGTVAIGKNSTLELANTSEIDITSTISNSSATAKILQSGSGTTNYTNDLSAYTGTYLQTDGTSNYTDKFFGGSSILEKGVINFKDGSSMTNNSSLAMGDGANVNITVGDGHNQNYNNFLDTAGATGSSQIVKDGSGTMTLSGDNSKYTGTFTQMEGVTEVAENTKLFGSGSNTTIAGGSMNLNNGVETSAGSEITINSGAQLNVNNTNGNIDLKSDIDGSGEINKNNDGDLTFSGDNTGFSGTTNINSSGDITFVNGLFGTVNFGDIDGKHVGIIADTVNGEINQTRDTTIKYSTVNDINLVFNDKVNVSKGTLEAVAREGKDVNFNGDVNIADAKIDVTAKNINFSKVVGVTDSNLDVKSEKVTFGDDVNIKDSTINSYAQSTIFNNNLLLDNGTLNIAYNGFDVTNDLTVGSTVNVMNGIIANNNIGGDLVVGPSGQSDFKIDIKPRGWTSDKTIVNGSITSALQGTVNISDFQFVGKAPIDRYIPLQLFQTSNPISDNIAFAATNKEIFTPIGYYKLFSTGGGGYTANLVKYNPQVFRGQVATTASYANQLVVNNTLFDHVNVISQRILAENNANKYAASIPQFAPYQYSRKTGGLWVKAYGNFETIGMTQGLNVGNNAYGTLVGADFPVVDLDNGWSFLPTAYIGYNGAHQTFNYTGMTQNGAQAGAMGTFMKDNFIGSLLAYGGGYGNQMEVAGFTENTGNWFAGAAAKAAYNFHPSKNFIIQPTLLASYNYFGSQNWHADFGDMSMSSSLLNGINVAPGLNLIYGRETWSVYATFQYMFNVMGYSKGRAGNVDLEGIKMRHDYFEYGIGFTKTWKDRLDTYLQITMRNGARTGVGFQGGLTFRF